jgi:hypothetical protein
MARPFSSGESSWTKTFGGKTEASSSLIGGPRRVVSADQHIPTVSCPVAARHFST